MIYYGKDYPTTNRDEWDDIAEEILIRAMGKEDFPLHHAIATHLRAEAASWHKKGYKKGCADAAQLISTLGKSWNFLMNTNIKQFCDVVVSKLKKI